jgi:nitroreductase
MIKDLVYANRSFRRFDGSVKIDKQTLTELVDLARCSASSGNIQPLKYIISCDAMKNAQIFPTMIWAGYLEDWDGPSENERPTAYIIIVGDTSISSNFRCDHGIAAQSILLGAAEKGFGGCMIGSIHRAELKELLNLPDKYEILLAIAMGKPVEKIVLEEVKADGDIKYYRDKDEVHHVPKRSLKEIILDI